MIRKICRTFGEFWMPYSLGSSLVPTLNGSIVRDLTIEPFTFFFMFRWIDTNDFFPIKKNERKSCIPQHFYPTLHSQRIRETGENPVQSRCCMFFILEKILKEILIPTPYSILATVSAQQPKWEGGATEGQARIPAVATCTVHKNRVFLP